MEDYTLSAIIELLNPDNTISAHRMLAHSLGMAEAVIYAALISKHTYYARNGMLYSNGWFFSTVCDLQESTTYGCKAQKTAIGHLIAQGLIECEFKGMPAKRYFRIINDAANLSRLISEGMEIARRLVANSRERIAEKTRRRSESDSEENVSFYDVPQENDFRTEYNCQPRFTYPLTETRYVGQPPYTYPSTETENVCPPIIYPAGRTDHEQSACCSYPTAGASSDLTAGTSSNPTAGTSSDHAAVSCSYPAAVSCSRPSHDKTKVIKPNIKNLECNSIGQTEPSFQNPNVGDVESVENLERSDRRTDFHKPSMKFSEVLRAIGLDWYDLSSSEPLSEQYFSEWGEGERKAYKCTIPYDLRHDKQAMITALKYVSGYSAYFEGGEWSKNEFFRTVIVCIAEMTEPEFIRVDGKAVMYYQIIDRLNEIIRKSSLADWMIEFEQEWKRIYSQRRGEIQNPKAYMKSCIWNFLNDCEFENYF